MTALSVNGNNIGDVGAAAVALLMQQNRTPKRLALRSHAIGDTGPLASLLRLRQATWRYWTCGNKIAAAGTRALAAAIAVRDFVFKMYAHMLIWCAVGGVQKNKGVAVLNLRSNAVDDAGAVDLAASLPNSASWSSILAGTGMQWFSL